MHYEGDDAILAGIQALGLDSASKVLDVGSGFGGPARLIAMEAQSSVVAMECTSLPSRMSSRVALASKSATSGAENGKRARIRP